MSVELPSSSRSISAFSLSFLFLLTLTLFSPNLLGAQAVSYTSVTEMEFGGPIGAMMQMVPDMETEVRETTFIKGSLMKTENEETATITNLESGETTFIQHEDKVYYTINTREWGERFAASGGPDEAMGEDSSDMDFDFEISTDRTGRTQRFDGFSAEQVLMTMTMIPRNEEARESMEESGSMVVFTELWLSEDFPGAEALESIQSEMAAGGVSDQGAGRYNASLQQAFAPDPRMAEAFARNMDELEGLRGIPVKTVTNMVMVPKGMEFDPDAVIEAADQPLESSGGMGDLLGQAAGAAASGAARQALGRMGGMLGRGRNQEPEEAPTGTQTIMTRVTSTLEDVQTSGIPDSVFAPPAGYQKQDPPWG